VGIVAPACNEPAEPLAGRFHAILRHWVAIVRSL
jgi:hypothetical protein